MAVTTKQYWAQKKQFLRKGVMFPTRTELLLSTVSAIGIFLVANVANGNIKF